MQRWQCPIHNWMNFVKSSVNFYLRSLGFLYIGDLFISSAGKHTELSELNIFKTWETTISSTELTDKGFKGTVVNRTLPSLHGGLLEITYTVF